LAEIADDGLAAAARVDIYRHHVFTTLTDVLTSTYPVVCRLVDPRFFAYAANEYIPDHLPESPCLFEYGASFPDFLATFPPCRHLAYLPDVGRLEWALRAARHTDDPPGLEPARLASVPSAETPWLGLRLDPSVAFIDSPWPIDRIWRSNQPGSDPEATVDLAAGGARLEVRAKGTTSSSELSRRQPLSSAAPSRRGIRWARRPIGLWPSIPNFRWSWRCGISSTRKSW
jgi:Putative DNA-binding domain